MSIYQYVIVETTIRQVAMEGEEARLRTLVDFSYQSTPKFEIDLDTPPSISYSTLQLKDVVHRWDHIVPKYKDQFLTLLEDVETAEIDVPFDSFSSDFSRNLDHLANGSAS